MVRFSISFVQGRAHGDAVLAADAEFRGEALLVAVLTKSLLLLSVSVSPPRARTITCVEVGVALTVPSKQFEVPHANLSTTVLATSDEQATLEMVVLNKPTFPLVPLKLKPVVTVEKSAVTGRAVPAVPEAPHSISRYFFAPTVVPAGKVKTFEVELP